MKSLRSLYFYYTITLGVLPFGTRRDGKLRFPRYYTTEGLKTLHFQHLLGVFLRYWIMCFETNDFNGSD